jgi:molybdopterin molybdotransferase
MIDPAKLSNSSSESSIVISTQQATELILGISPTINEVEIVPLHLALHRVLAESVVSQLDFPHWDNSAMDGYALRWADLQAGIEPLQVVSEISAGIAPTKSIESGQAARIFTGAMLPAGADTIIIQENTQRIGDQLQIMKLASAQGEFVRRQGDFAKAGDVLLTKGTKLLPASIAVLAAAQYPQVQVYRKTRVAILSTGNELVQPGDNLAPGQIVDSNQYALTALIQQWGGEPIWLGSAPDNPQELAVMMQRAIDAADIVLSTGGVSVGDYDYVDRVLAELGGEIQITAVAVKPGKPLTVATFEQPGGRTLYFGLPGNPVSALVSCWRFIYLGFQQVAGIADPQLPWSEAVTGVDLRSDNRRESYLWGRVELNGDRQEFMPVAGGHNSGNLINLARANALAMLPVGQNAVAGDAVQILLIS